MLTVKKEGKGRIFETPVLEVLTKTNPVLHIITYGGAIALFLYMSTTAPLSTVLLFIGGAITWTLVEYVIHRFLFHIKPGKFQYMIHGVHHEYPRDKERLMMPPVPGILLTLFFFGLWYVFFQSYAHAFMSGFLTGYLAYTYIHYIVHAHKPVKGFRFLWTHHLKHHNPVFHDKAYGVSTPFWDHIFGTMPKKEAKPGQSA